MPKLTYYQLCEFPTILVCEHGSPEQENLDFTCYFEFSWSEFLYFSSFTKYFSHSLPYSTPISYIYIQIHWYTDDIYRTLLPWYMQIFLESYGQIERKFSRVAAIWFFAQFTFFGHMITCAKNQTIANIYLLYLGCTLTIQKCKLGWFAQEKKKNSLFFDFWN